MELQPHINIPRQKY